MNCVPLNNWFQEINASVNSCFPMIDVSLTDWLTGTHESITNWFQATDVSVDTCFPGIGVSVDIVV